MREASENPSTNMEELPKYERIGDGPRGQIRTGSGDGDDSREAWDTERRRGSGVKRPDMGRSEWSKNRTDKRARNEETQQAAKRQKLDGNEGDLPYYATQYPMEELLKETKRQKRKVAVMVGYSGTGYKGMQLSRRERTIEGDLFKAFADAGAVSKNNANDPKKVALVRCARTDKGVHAAGNLISIKLIIDDPDIVEKINQHLSTQIRVFGYTRANASFSAYQCCDSRIYEYLIPTHCFLPPHPESYLGQKLDQLAKEADDDVAYHARQREVSSFWAEAEEQYITPVFEQIDLSIQPIVRKALYDISIQEAEGALAKDAIDRDATADQISSGKQTNAVDTLDDPNNDEAESVATHNPETVSNRNPEIRGFGTQKLQENGAVSISESKAEKGTSNQTLNDPVSTTKSKEPSPLESAVRQLKTAYINAKKAYRISPERLQRVRSTLSRFVGTQNFHNYTVDKTAKDASAKRVIRSFTISDSPLIKHDTEWLSLKVHGQSFMMHQIRKMVSMTALIVRCGCHEGRIQDSYLHEKMSIPKAPGLGLLLERPLFDAYNEKLVKQFDREPIEFRKFEGVMEEFKQREIYERIWREEEEHGRFHSFFAALDNTKNSSLLYLSSVGPGAVKREDVPKAKREAKKEIPFEGPSSGEEEVSGAEDG